MKLGESVSALVTNVLLLVLCAMGGALLARPPQEAHPQAPDGPTQGNAQDHRELQLAMEKLAVVLSRLCSGEQPISSSPPAPANGKPVSANSTMLPPLGSAAEFESAAFRDLLGGEPKREQIRAMLLEETSEHELLIRFAFRSYRSIIGELGFPDQIRSTSEGVIFYYQADASLRETYLQMIFRDGVVTQVRR